MGVLDSTRSQKSVLKKLRLYFDFVTPGQWNVVVEDANVNGRPALPRPGDATSGVLCERFLLTQNSRGWLGRRNS